MIILKLNDYRIFADGPRDYFARELKFRKLAFLNRMIYLSCKPNFALRVKESSITSPCLDINPLAWRYWYKNVWPVGGITFEAEVFVA